MYVYRQGAEKVNGTIQFCRCCGLHAIFSLQQRSHVNCREKTPTLHFSLRPKTTIDCALVPLVSRVLANLAAE